MVIRPRAVARALGLPRDPLHRAHWLARLLGPVLALPLAALVALWLTDQALLACPNPPACRPLVVLTGGGAVTLLIASLTPGLALGLWASRQRRPWLPYGLAVVVAAGLSLLPALLAPGAVLALPPSLLTLAALLSVLVVSMVITPVSLIRHLLAIVQHDRHRWWSASLRAARLTRRTLGLGSYRQLCRAGHIRVASTLYPVRVYLVPRRTSPSGARVLVEERGRVIGGLCLRPREPLPDPEEVVAHVLLLRGDERGYLKAANFFPYDTILTHQATARRL